MDKKRIESTALLVLTAMIWGLAFVAQQVGTEKIGPLTFIALRYLLGALAVAPCLLFFAEKKISGVKLKKSLIAGIICGVILFVASYLQQRGLMMTTVGKAGFISALYIIIIPIIGLFWGKKVSRTIWLALAVALIGMYLLCMTGSLKVEMGDFLVLLCAAGFSCHILSIDHFLSHVDVIYLSVVQFLVAGILSLIFMIFFETPDMTSILQAKIPILYTGILSSGVAYTLQIIGQKHVKPVIASLIMSLESVFSLLAGFLILGDTLTSRELLGCTLMFVAIIIAQVPNKKIAQ
ncbi:permease [Lactococcus hodotermopsidis]|uniref:Permease n=1 Tax=Pseudolactococcus hodotermopsidis TaxID=2709157 RepID=A0A6A0BAQ1_9LACT|nr:DMT family transporter [Lactococcus hodotermopsidis]GFH42480.1 permease [Lactococcus hodotermopsidis]